MFPRAAVPTAVVVALLVLALPARALKIEMLSPAEMGPLGLGAKPSAQPIQVVAGRVLVKFQPSMARAQKKALLDPLGHSIAGELSKIGWTVVELASGTRVAAGLQVLRGLPGIIAVAPDYAYRTHATPNDPDVPQQYGLSQIDAFGAWNYATGSTNRVTIAVIDSGIDGTQPDLDSKLPNTTSVFFDPDSSLSPTIISTGSTIRVATGTAITVSTETTLPTTLIANAVNAMTSIVSTSPITAISISTGAMIAANAGILVITTTTVSFSTVATNGTTTVDTISTTTISGSPVIVLSTETIAVVSTGTLIAVYSTTTIDSAFVDNPPTAACDHATQVSGVAAASTNNGYEIAGVSWGAQLMSLRVFNQADCNSDCSDSDPNCSVDGGNCCATDDVAISSAILYATNFQGQPGYGDLVINMSLGGVESCSSVAAAAIAVATGAAIPVVIAAGNSGPGGDTINSPANCASTSLSGGVIPVGATDQNNNIASFSSTGQELAANGVVAPGVGILTTTLSSATASVDGTSFATPHVAGLAALILSAIPSCTSGACAGAANCAACVQNIIRNTADNIGLSQDYQGAGRINAFKALRLATQGTLANYAGQQEPIAFPNPFRIAQANNLSFSIPPSLAGASPTIKIYTVSGQLVKELTGLTWDGRNASGNLAASGTYIFLIQTSNGQAKGRFAVIH